MSIVPSNYVGATQLNPSVTTYDGLIKRIKHTLGYPLVEIEVSDEQIIDFINESVEYFSKYAGYTEEFLVFDTKLYNPHTGLQIEKLINSTCAYNTSAVGVSVVNVPTESYYTNNNNIYLSHGSNDQMSTNSSFTGTVYLSNYITSQPFNFAVNRGIVELTPNTFYTQQSSLYQSGESLSANSAFSLSGSFIQSFIGNVAPYTVNVGITSVNLVNLEPNTLYIHNNSLYRSGSSTDYIISDTSGSGELLQNSVNSPQVSTISITETISVVNVPPNSYYVSGNSLWKSATDNVGTGKSLAGSMILNNLPVYSIQPINVSKTIKIVNILPDVYYIQNNQLWKSQSLDYVETSYSDEGVLVNNYLLNVLVDEFVHPTTQEVIQAVPVPPDTVYFNQSVEPPTLYRSSSAVDIVNGYSLVGQEEQSSVSTIAPTLTTISVTVSAISGVHTNSLYLNGTTVWRSGSSYNSQYTDAGSIYATNIPLGISMTQEITSCSVNVVNVDVGTYYLSGNDLYITSITQDDDVPTGYSCLGSLIIKDVPFIDYYLVGAIAGSSYGVVSLPPNTYYKYNNNLYRSGIESNSLLLSSSLSGTFIQDNILSRNYNIYTTLTEVVSVSEYSLYLYNNKLYRSGQSRSDLSNGLSNVGSVVLSAVHTDTTISIQSYTGCYSMYYDYDLFTNRKVIDCFSFDQGESTGINTLFTLEQAMAQQIYSSYMVGNFGFDLVTWEVLKDFIDTRNKVLAQKPHFRFDNRSQTLRIIPEPRTEESYIGLVGCYIERPLKDLIKERWVYDYAKALTMIAVGNVRGKYSGTGLFGGGSVNGNDIRSQGLSEKDNLEKTLITEYRDNTPAMFFVG